MIYLVLACRSGDVVRLERPDPFSALRTSQRLRNLGWAVTVARADRVEIVR